MEKLLGGPPDRGGHASPKSNAIPRPTALGRAETLSSVGTEKKKHNDLICD